VSTAKPSRDSIVCNAVEISSPQERAKYVARACGDDAALRRQVEALVAAHFEAGSFLEQPAVAERTGAYTPDPAPEEKPKPAANVEGPGAVIGPYKLLQQIGEGGMGAVFMAEQTRPVQRKIAIKLIKQGMDSGQVIARFEAERQALAMMDHPNIARVLDTGATDSGRPYFVMELVKGLPITKYCDERRLTPKQRLELFVPVCQAVQHAHQKGVIHRDLKPSNVLVAQYDGKPAPKVIDFGVAKATGQKLTERTLFTEFGSVVGTLEYMSPEQAELNQLDIDTRSDVYSLGVLLYELLTGTTPLERKRLKDAALLELLRIIREEEPPRPSTRLSESKESLSSISAQRQTEPAKLTKVVRGELDWIVMKALEKDRNRRYESASAFARDVQRYLADEPVLACPRSAWYRVRKFAQRNRAALTVGSALLTALAVVLCSVGWLMWDRTAKEAALDAEATRAAEEIPSLIDAGKWPEGLERIQRTQKLLVAGGRPAGDLPAALRELDKDLAMAQRLEEIQGQPSQPGLETESEEPAFDSLLWADVFEVSEAEASYARAFQEYGIDVTALPIEEAAARIRGRSIRLELARALDLWSSMGRRPGRSQGSDWKRLLAVAKLADPDPWRNQLREALERSDRKSLEKLAASADITSLSPATLHLLGVALLDLGAHTEAVVLLRQAQQQYPGDLWLNATLGENVLKPDEKLRFYQAALAMRPNSHSLAYSVAWALDRKGSRAEADALYTKLTKLNPVTSAAWTARARAHEKLKQWDRANADFTTAIEKDPDNPTRWLTRAFFYERQKQWDKEDADLTTAIKKDPKRQQSWLARARLYERLNQWDKAAADYSTAVDLATERNLGSSTFFRAVAYERFHQWDKALADFTRAAELEPRLAETWDHLGFVHSQVGQWHKAATDFTKGIELDPNGPHLRSKRGVVFGRLGQWDKALADFTKATELAPKFTRAWEQRGVAYGKLGKWRDAVAVYTWAIELDPKQAPAWGARGYAYSRLGEWDKALADYLKVIELDPNQGEKARADSIKAIQNAPKSGAAFTQVGGALVGMGWFEAAVPVLQKALELDPKAETARVSLGLALLRNKQLDESIAVNRKVLDLNAKSVVARSNLALALKGQGKLDEAIVECRKCVEFEPRSAASHFLLAFCLADSNQGAEAIAEYTTAIELLDAGKTDVTRATVHNGLAWLLATHPNLKLRDPVRAVKLAKVAVELAPDGATLWNTLGVAHYRAGEWKAALGALEKSMELRQGQGSDSSDWFFVAMCHGKLGDKERGRQWYDWAANWMDGNPTTDEDLRPFRSEAAEVLGLDRDPGDDHYSLGIALEAEGRLDEAVAEFREAIRVEKAAKAQKNHCIAVVAAIRACRAALTIHPNNVEAHCALGAVLCDDKNDVEGAIREFQAALKIDPKHANTHCNLGVALRKKKDFDGAIREFHAAVALRPNWAEAYRQLGRTLWEQDRPEDARAAYREAIRLTSKEGVQPGRLTFATPWSDSDHWIIQGEELHQLDDGPRGHVLLFGDPNWADYDFEAEAQVTAGGSEVGLVFRATSPSRRLYAIVGGFLNTRHGIIKANEGGAGVVGLVEGKSEKGRWYRLRVEARGNRFKMFLDDKLLMTVDSDDHPRGCLGLITNPVRARFRNLKVTDAGGAVLLEGVQGMLPAPKGDRTPTGN
jgi:tetratricopeptide (TPR) repeat protein